VLESWKIEPYSRAHKCAVGHVRYGVCALALVDREVRPLRGEDSTSYIASVTQKNERLGRIVTHFRANRRSRDVLGAMSDIYSENRMFEIKWYGWRPPKAAFMRTSGIVHAKMGPRVQSIFCLLLKGPKWSGQQNKRCKRFDTLSKRATFGRCTQGPKGAMERKAAYLKRICSSRLLLAYNPRDEVL
jgi:hypothetical protein